MEPLVAMLLAFSAGWFLRSATQWRRDAKRARVEIVHAAPPPAPPPAAIEPRVERLLERLTERMETLEDRIDFAERILDARGTPVRPRSLEAQARAVPEASTRP